MAFGLHCSSNYVAAKFSTIIVLLHTPLSGQFFELTLEGGECVAASFSRQIWFCQQWLADFFSTSYTVYF